MSLPSVIDRLIEEIKEDEEGNALPMRWGEEEIRGSILRNLENMFNTRQWMLYQLVALKSQGRGMGLLSGSLVGYGLADFSVINLIDDKIPLQRTLEAAILNFEPRIASVSVEVKTGKKKSGYVSQEDEEQENQKIQELCFEVYARLKEPMAASVMFQTVLNLSRGAYAVKER